ncbi:MAG: hypothetical protein AAGL98_02330, partial [Planctomycetota bacterium]
MGNFTSALLGKFETALTQGTCTDWQYRYLCGTPQTETGGTCRPVNVCAGGVCLETPEEESNDFG